MIFFHQYYYQSFLKEQMKKIDYNIDDFFHRYYYQSFSKEQMKMQCGLEYEILREK